MEIPLETQDNPLKTEVLDAIRAGKKIEAIKRLRESRGLELAEATRIVDQYCQNHPDSLPKQSGRTLHSIFLCAMVLLIFGVYKYFVG